MSYVEEAGDPYKEEMEQCIDLIMAELRRRDVDNPYKLAYQVRVYVRWRYECHPTLTFALDWLAFTLREITTSPRATPHADARDTRRAAWAPWSGCSRIRTLPSRSWARRG